MVTPHERRFPDELRWHSCYRIEILDGAPHIENNSALDVSHQLVADSAKNGRS